MATRASRAAFIRQTFSALNFKGELSPNKREATVFHPGLTYGDFHGRTPAIWKLMKVMEGSRFFAHHAISPSGDNFMEYDTLTNDRMTFIGSTEFLVGRGMYVRSVTKSPLDVKLCLHHIGKSSLSTQARVFCHDSEQLLLSNINQVVSIDPASRRPLPLPDWWRDKYSVATISQTPMVVQSEARPDDALRNDVIVSWSDTDFYEHTNWTSYVKYCVDAANLCSLKGHLREVASDTVRENAVKTLRVRYSGESLLGDTLQVYAWEVAQNAIKFQICKDDTPICFIFMEYFLASDLDDH